MTGRVGQAISIGILVTAFVASAHAQTGSQPSAQAGTDQPDDVVVVAVKPLRDVVVRAPPHCARRPGDPADAVPVHHGRTEQRAIVPDRQGHLVWTRDNEQIAEPGVWRRAGSGIGQYVFRVPGPDRSGDPSGRLPLCIGAAVDSPSGWGQLRQIIRTEPGMIGKYLHFSALVAARDAAEIRFWLVAAGRGARVRGGDTHASPIKGTFGWKQVDVIVGPVPSYADHISYGFLLWGKGDVWLTDPVLDVKTLEDVKKVPALPTTSIRPPSEQ